MNNCSLLTFANVARQVVCLLISASLVGGRTDAQTPETALAAAHDTVNFSELAASGDAGAAPAPQTPALRSLRNQKRALPGLTFAPVPASTDSTRAPDTTNPGTLSFTSSGSTSPF